MGDEVKSERRHKTTAGGVTVWAESWCAHLGGDFSCWLYEDEELAIRVTAYLLGFHVHEVTAERHWPPHMATVLAAVLLEAAEIAEGGEVPS